MSGRIVDYIIVCSEDASEISSFVHENLKAGWKLYGTPFVNGEYFCQAMVKEVY